MFKSIKRFTIAALLMAFSASAFAVGNYCVNFPRYWDNNHFTKHDNDVAAQVMIHYDKYVLEEHGESNDGTPTTTYRRTGKTGIAYWDEKWRSSFRDSDFRGANSSNRGGWAKHCIHTPTHIKKWADSYTRHSNDGHNKITGFRMRLISSGWPRQKINCPFETIQQASKHDNNFYIHHVASDVAQPWRCRR